MADDLAPTRRRQRAQRQARAEGLLQDVAARLRPGDLVLDCGAQWGDVTAPLAATGATVHAYEPDPLNLDRLRARCGHSLNVVIHPAAVGTAAGTATLYRHPRWPDDPKRALAKSTLLDGHPQMARAERVAVPVIDLPALIATRGDIGVLKLDVEGAELGILETLLARRAFDRIGLTLVETHERLFPALQPRYAALRAAIAAAWPPARVNLDWT